MPPNPYEAPANDKGKVKRRGVRLTTIAVFAMLFLLAGSCFVLAGMAKWISLLD